MEFHYKGLDSAGNPSQGTLEANTIEDAKTKIKDKVDVIKADTDWPNLDNGSKVEPSVFELNISEEVPILNINLKGKT